MKPSHKHPEMEAVIQSLTGIDRRAVINADICAMCGREASQFRDAVSAKEYSISGMCQQCQDSFFIQEEEEDDE